MVLYALAVLLTLCEVWRYKIDNGIDSIVAVLAGREANDDEEDDQWAEDGLPLFSMISSLSRTMSRPRIKATAVSPAELGPLSTVPTPRTPAAATAAAAAAAAAAALDRGQAVIEMAPIRHRQEEQARRHYPFESIGDSNGDGVHPASPLDLMESNRLGHEAPGDENADRRAVTTVDHATWPTATLGPASGPEAIPRRSSSAEQVGPGSTSAGTDDAPMTRQATGHSRRGTELLEEALEDGEFKASLDRLFEEEEEEEAATRTTAL